MAKAAQAPNFGALLDKPATDFEAPKPLPAGSYIAVVAGLPRFDKSSKKQTEFVEFTYNILKPLEDVDPDELKEMGGVQGKSIRNPYYITEDSLYRLREFLEHCRIEVDGVSLRTAIDETPGKQIVIFIGHEATEDGRTFARVRRTAPVE